MQSAWKPNVLFPEAEDTLCETRRRQPAAFHGRSVSASRPSARAAPGSPRCMHRPDRCITPLQFSAKGPQAEAMAPPSHPFGIDTNNSNPPRAARVSWFFCADLAPRPPIIAYPRNLPPPAVRFGVAWRPATGSGSLPSPCHLVSLPSWVSLLHPPTQQEDPNAVSPALGRRIQRLWLHCDVSHPPKRSARPPPSPPTQHPPDKASPRRLPVSAFSLPLPGLRKALAA
ncbi:hypothetical protein ACCO45_000786 [Purpureocillium lilacinum]|uniref:Uncharacterized protein n=1 Tax=Purpureocillium lilacinum TaxID=33203 RepID=A0ACC4E6I7_PURLI